MNDATRPPLPALVLGADDDDAPAEDELSADDGPQKGNARSEVLAVLRSLGPCLRRHRVRFLAGAAAALVVVGSRLALPWPLRGIADQLTGGTVSTRLAWLPLSIDPVLAMGAAFLALTFVLGLADMLERSSFAKFASASVADLREAALRDLGRARAAARSGGTADTVSRLTADAARFKSGISSFLVHVATNGVVLFGVTMILLLMEGTLGLVFAVATLGTVVVTAFASWKVFARTRRHRRHAGEFANALQSALAGARDADGAEAPFAPLRGRGSARVTFYIGLATWIAHSLFGAAVLAALWLGADAVRSGRIAVGDLMVIMMYALMLRGPIVRLARQGAKMGRMFGAGYRLVQLTHPEVTP